MNSIGYKIKLNFSAKIVERNKQDQIHSDLGHFQLVTEIHHFNWNGIRDKPYIPKQEVISVRHSIGSKSSSEKKLESGRNGRWELPALTAERAETMWRRLWGANGSFHMWWEAWAKRCMSKNLYKIVRAMTHVERASCYRHCCGIGIPLNRADLAAGRCHCPNCGVCFSVFLSLWPCSFSLRVLRLFLSSVQTSNVIHTVGVILSAGHWA